jgi:hypothetical protein
MIFPGFGGSSSPPPVQQPRVVEDKSGDDDTTKPREERIRRRNRMEAIHKAQEEGSIQLQNKLGRVGASAVK